MLPRRRCRCNRQRVPRRRARVGGLCGFRGTVERVPAKHQKTGRCADVRELYGNGRHRRKPPAGGLQRRTEPQAARQEKSLALFCASPATSAHSAGSFEG